MVLCNDANIGIGQDKTEVIGDSTEIALLVFAYKNDITKDRIDPELPRVHEIPFTAERKMMTTIHKNLDNNKLEAYIKGASEAVLRWCSKIVLNGESLALSEDMKDRIMVK